MTRYFFISFVTSDFCVVFDVGWDEFDTETGGEPCCTQCTFDKVVRSSVLFVS